MRSQLRRIWSLPWPAPLRQLAMRIMSLPVLRLSFFPHFLVGVVGIVENRRGELLLLRHTYRREYPWGLPSGFLEHGEQPADGLRREVSEETGMTIELLGDPVVYTSTGHPYVNIVYRCKYIAGSFSPSPEVSAAQFFSLTRLPRLSPEQQSLLTTKEHCH